MKLISAGILVVWLFTVCSGITPYQPHNHREEGPQQEIFTGPSGEFSIETRRGQRTSAIGSNQSVVVLFPINKQIFLVPWITGFLLIPSCNPQNVDIYENA